MDGPSLICSQCNIEVELDRAIALGNQELFGCPNCDNVEFWEVPAMEVRLSSSAAAVWHRIAERVARPGNGTVPDVAT